jgi:DUF4097 and DUF4098 domain-containing protein YvlB
MIRKLCLFSVMLLSACTVLAEQDIINKSFDAKPGGTLFMDVDRGSIKILTSNTDKVEVEVVREIKRASAEKAREVFARHKIDFSQDDGTVRIEAENKTLNPIKNLFNNLQVEYTITIPSKFDLDLRTAGGNISVEDLDGQAKVQTTGGSLNIGAVTGEIRARTSGGNIKIAGSKSNVDANTAGGSLAISNIDGKLVARTSGGNITLDHIKGAIDANTTGGTITLSDAESSIKAVTSGGNVVAELSDRASGECTLKTTGGSVKVTLPEKMAVDLEASTTGGQVKSDFDGEFNKQRTKLIAKLNGGGPEMRLSTTGGNVDIRKK